MKTDDKLGVVNTKTNETLVVAGIKVDYYETCAIRCTFEHCLETLRSLAVRPITNIAYYLIERFKINVMVENGAEVGQMSPPKQKLISQFF